MERAVDWYHRRLLSGADAAAARSYLRSRGYDGEVVRAYRLGWAPDAWDALCRALAVDDDVLRDTGLGVRNKVGRQQDVFRARVMFPILDVRGDPVGFGGRALEGGPPPKYRNSAETPLYSKSRVLYGLNWAKAAVVEAGEVVVCEGYTDVIGLATAGVGRAVATCGTALADEHFRVLKNFARRVVLAYDADAAGQAAAERFYEWEKRYEVDIRVVELPAGADPGSLAQSDPAGLRAAIEGAPPFLGFRLGRALAGADLRTPEGRARAAEAGLAVIREHPGDLVRDQYLMQLSDRVRIPPDRLRLLLAAPAPRPREDGTGERGPSPTGARTRERAGPEIEALRLAVHRPESIADRLHEVLFTSPVALAAYRALCASDTLHQALERADADAPAAATLLRRLAVEDADSDLDDVLARLADEAAKRAVADLEAAFRSSDDPMVYAGDLAWLKLTIEELHADRVTAVEATGRLVRWLVTRFEVDG